MGVTKDANKAVGDKLYEDAREYLRKKNGLTHVMCFMLEGKLGAQAAQCETRVTTMMNQILLGLQTDEYEVLDIKIEPVPSKDWLSGQRQMYLATITYK